MNKHTGAGAARGDRCGVVVLWLYLSGVFFFCYFFFTNVPTVHTAHSHRWRGSRQLHRTPTCKHHITRSNHRCVSVIYYVTSAKICDTWPGRPLHALQYRRTQPLLWAHRGRRGTVGVIVFKKKNKIKKKAVSGNTKGLRCFSCGTVGDGGAGHFRHHGKNPSVLLSCIAPFSNVFMNPNSLVSDFPLTWLSSQQLLSKKKNSSRRFSITRCLPNAGFLVRRQRLPGSGRLYFALLNSISKKHFILFCF